MDSIQSITKPSSRTAASLPRVLFVTPCGFNRLSGGGITYANLFRGWAQDRLATVHRDRLPQTSDVCSLYYPLGWNELTPSVPFSGGVWNRGRLSRSLEEWIRAFSPQVIYSVLGTLGYMDLVNAIQERFRLPLVVHLMDEGVTDPQVKGWMSSWIRDRYERANRLLITKAAVRLGICEKMSAVYAERYDVPFETFMNTVDMDAYPSRTTVHPGQELRLVYTGSILSFSQEESLQDVCEVVRTMHLEGIPIRLDIYTPLKPLGQAWKNIGLSPGVHLHDAIQDDALYFKTLQEADLLVSPANFDARSIQFIRYSMPTKIPSYLCSGTPILVYGPGEIAQVEYAEKGRWGYVVKQRGPQFLREAIRVLSQDAALRKTLSETAVATARRNHDSSIVRKRFQDALAKAIHG